MAGASWPGAWSRVTEHSGCRPVTGGLPPLIPANAGIQTCPMLPVALARDPRFRGDERRMRAKLRPAYQRLARARLQGRRLRRSPGLPGGLPARSAACRRALLGARAYDLQEALKRIDGRHGPRDIAE